MHTVKPSPTTAKPLEVESRDTPPSLWDEHKIRTKRALHEAALDLFTTQGYESTTIDQIARKARASKRTFFRYFPTKEAALFWVHGEWVQLLADTYASQPSSMSEIEALSATFRELAARLPSDRMLRYLDVVRSSPALRGRSPENVQDELIRLADAIAIRRSLSRTDEDCILLAFVGWITDKRAHDRWAELGPDADLSAIVEDEFNRLARTFSI